VDPWSPREWAREIWELSTNDTALEELRGRVSSGYKPRTWADTARVVKEEIDRLA
jgi:hypothetical protein